MMGKRKKARQKKGGLNSLKWALIPYIPVVMVLAVLGCYLIGIYSNYAQEWYSDAFAERREAAPRYEIMEDGEGRLIYSYVWPRPIFYPNRLHQLGYFIVSSAQFLLMPLWVLLCIGVTGMVFYRRELEKPIGILTDAAEKISENCLDFAIEPVKDNELGLLCRSFEDMRSALAENNRRMWSMMEGHKRLNAAFAHDMRTPLTVLAGYTELLTKHVADGRISEAKTMEILGLMQGQIARLKHYTQKMSTVRKLEDVSPERREVAWERFQRHCRDTGKVLTKGCQMWFWGQSDAEALKMDEELVLEVYENLLSNAMRYAKSWVNVSLTVRDGLLEMVVEDDGKGFSREALECAAEPFYREALERAEEPFCREDGERNEHYGLGLYVCRMLCEKCNGSLLLENGDAGAKVTATFRSR